MQRNCLINAFASYHHQRPKSTWVDTLFTGIAPCGTLHGALPQHWSVPATFSALQKLKKHALKKHRNKVIRPGIIDVICIEFVFKT